MDSLADQALATLLVSLRVAPALGFAPPFTLLRAPATVRLMLAISLAAWLVAGFPDQTWKSGFRESGLFMAGIGELFIGLSVALSLQLAFAALLTAGRGIDIQAGFGLAALIDPGTRAPLPLVGTLFVYAAGAIFFATTGPADLLAVYAASIAKVPLGGASIGGHIGTLAAFLSSIFLMAFGSAGMVMLALFLLDLSIAFMSRTLPQMNVLLLGFQVKTLATLLLLPIAISLSGALFLRMLRYALETAAEMV